MIGRGSAGRLPSRACANNRDMQLRQLVTHQISPNDDAAPVVILLVTMLGNKKKLEAVLRASLSGYSLDVHSSLIQLRFEL